MKHLKTERSSVLNFRMIIPQGLILVVGIFLAITVWSYTTEIADLKKGELNYAALHEYGKTGDKKKDAFAKKPKKGPNIYSSRPPRTKSRSKLYQHAISKKRVKRSNNAVFSDSKRRYNVVDTKSNKKGTKSIFGGRKSNKQKK